MAKLLSSIKEYLSAESRSQGQYPTRAVQYDIVVEVSNLFNYKTLHLSIKILVNISCALRVHFLLQIETLEGFISFVRVI